MAEHYIPLSQTVVDGTTYNPGDTIIFIAGTRGRVDIQNVNGTAAQPIHIINGNGRVTFNAAGAFANMRIYSCTHIHITGTGRADIEYGFKMINGSNCCVWWRDASEHLEIDHIEMDGDYAGFRCGPQETYTGPAFIMYDLSIHHCYIHNMSHEAFYAGHNISNQDGRPMYNVEIYECICEECAWDAIQLRAATGGTNSIHDNTCRNIGAGVFGTTQGGAGIILGEGTRCEVYDNVIDHADRGIQCLSQGANCLIHHNVIYDCGYVRDQDGIVVFTDGGGMIIYNNTVVNSTRSGIKTKTGDNTVTLRSNLIAQWGLSAISSSGTLQNNCTFTTVAAAKFVDAANHDYRLADGSPAIGAGYNGVDCGALPVSSIVPPARKVRAFPSAQGAGALAQGGRGSTVYKVTTLANSGVGSFRAACEASGYRYVVFTVAGYIDLLTEINITNPYITIIGQSAPGHGITLRGARVRISTHDVVCRYLRFAPGPTVTNPEDTQALIIEYQADQLGNVNRMPHHIIFDHCTFRWATDANVRLRNSNWNLFGSNAGIERIQYITFQWCLFYENFDDVGSIDHSYNFVIGGGCTNITLHHNILGNCRARNPMINGGTVELINNLIFNCPQGIRFGGPVDQSGLEPVYANCIGNWEYHGNDTAANHFCLFSENGSACTDPEDEKLHQIYPLDNRGRYRPGWPLDSEWLVMGCGPGAGNTADERWWVTSPHILVGGRPVTVHTTLTAYNKMIAHAGCTMPLCFGRDGADQAFIQSVKAHGGSIPSSTMAQVSGGGWPALSAGYPTPADPDNDGIWSWFETANGSNPAVADQDDYDYVTAPYRAVYNNIETWANVIDHNPHVVTRVQVN